MCLWQMSTYLLIQCTEKLSKVCTETYLVHTWYVREKTTSLNVHDVQIRTNNLMHTKQMVIPLRNQSKVLGDIIGSSRVYVDCATRNPVWLVLDIRRRSLSAFAAVMTSLIRTLTWISLARNPKLAAKHSLGAAMWRRTAARLRNRSLVLGLGKLCRFSYKVPNQLGQSKRFESSEVLVLCGWQTSYIMTEDHVSSVYCC
jgi:hypothetical protein